jgi:hypothetical protein
LYERIQPETHRAQQGRGLAPIFQFLRRNRK